MADYYSVEPRPESPSVTCPVIKSRTKINHFKITRNVIEIPMKVTTVGRILPGWSPRRNFLQNLGWICGCTQKYQIPVNVSPTQHKISLSTDTRTNFYTCSSLSKPKCSTATWREVSGVTAVSLSFPQMNKLSLRYHSHSSSLLLLYLWSWMQQVSRLLSGVAAYYSVRDRELK